MLARALRGQQHILHILTQQEVALRQVERLRVHRRAALLQRRHRRRSDFVAVAHVTHRNLNRHDRRSRRLLRRRFGRRDVLVIEHNLVLACALRSQQHILHILAQQEVALRQVERLRVHRRAALLQRRHRRRSDFVAVAHVAHRNLNRHDRRSRRRFRRNGRRRFGRRDVLVIEHNLVLARALRGQQHILHILTQQEVALRQVERLRVHRRAALLQRRHRRRSDFVAVAHVAHRNLNRHDRRSRRRFRRRFGRRVQRARRFRQGRKRRNVQVIARARFSIGGIGHDFHRRARGQRRARVRHKGQQTAR